MGLVILLAFAIGCELDEHRANHLAPTNVIMKVNNGDVSTGDTLIRVTVGGYNIDYMQISLDAQFRNSIWQDFDTLTLMNVPRREGNVYVYGRFYTEGGDTSGVYRDGIIVDLSAAIASFNVAASGNTLRPGDQITFSMETGERGEATVDLGELSSGFKLLPTSEGAFSRIFTVPDGFRNVNVRPAGQFTDLVGNRATPVESDVTFTVEGQELDPRRLGGVQVEGMSPTELFYKDGYVFISDAGFRVHLVNVSPPVNSAWISSFELAGYGGGISGNGQIMAVAAGDAGVVIFAVNPPGATNQVGRVLIPGKAQDVLVVGDVGYVACIYTGLYTLDLREMRHPRILGHIEMQGYGESLAFNHDTVFVGGISGIAAIDARDIYNPRLISELYIDGLPIEEVYWEGRLYVATSRKGIAVVDVRDAKEMKITGVHQELSPSNSLAFQPPFLFIGGYDRVTIVNAAIPERLPVVGIMTDLLQTRGMVVNHHLLYVSAVNALHVFEFLE